MRVGFGIAVCLAFRDSIKMSPVVALHQRRHGSVMVSEHDPMLEKEAQRGQAPLATPKKNRRDEKFKK